MKSIREPKPDWQSVPKSVKDAIEGFFGSGIRSGEIVWGGYSPSATFLLTLANGRKIFCKGCHPGQTDFGKKQYDF